MAPLRFVLALHNHQPIGNFDGVIEQAYQDSYLPFLRLFAGYDALRCALHTSGALIEWLDRHHPEYLDELAELVAAGRVEIIGGAFFEPILAMLPRRDRIGQIRRYSEWLERRLGGRVRGMWIPERVWEQGMAGDIAAAGIEYTLLDDFHFKNAGLVDEQLHGYYVTEDDGRVLKVFPGSERLRYLIPFADPQETVNHLQHIARQHPQGVVVFGDDGEKFGTWPETKRHVYDNGWLARFLDALSANQEWLLTTTLADAVDNVAPQGKVFLPDASYREMTEWALPAEQLVDYEHLRHEMESDARWPRLKRFVRGGFWRNFKVKYPESDEMYTRMLGLSRRLAEAEASSSADEELLEQARLELYRGQCNCSYWHGAFGGIYLPHLRNAVYRNLIGSDNLLDQAQGRFEPWVEVSAEDFNLDARQEVRLANDRLLAWVAPARGGMLYELDVRAICHNLLATLCRRPEAYHEKVRRGASPGDASCASIHDRVVFKQAGLDQCLQYDEYPRKSMLDHFLPADATAEQFAAGAYATHTDFLRGVYETRLRRAPGRAQVVLSREGLLDGQPVRLTKSLTLEAGNASLDISYELEGLAPGKPCHLAMEFNFAGLPAGADDRYFFDIERRRLGQLGSRLNLTDAQGLGLADEWLGIGVALRFSRPTGLWTFPIETVSQSEAGFELVHQSVVVVPHWQVVADDQGRWSVSLALSIDTSLAESRREQAALAAR